MSCPYFDEAYFGTCCASESRYVPSMEKRESYCFRRTYRFCPTLLERLYESNTTTSSCSPKKESSYVNHFGAANSG